MLLKQLKNLKKNCLKFYKTLQKLTFFMKKRSKNFTFSLLLALILSFVGGILEAYSLTNRGFFALMQTGNLISVFINLVKTDWNSLLVSFVVVFTFIVGLIISNVIEFICEKKKKDYQPFELMICVALLVLVIFIPVEYTSEEAILEAKDLSWPNVLGNIVLALIGSMLLESFRKMNSKNYTSTMMTANLQRMVSSFFIGEEKHDKNEIISGFDYVLVILSFGVGVMISYGYFHLLKEFFANNYSYWMEVIPNLILLVPICILIATLIGRYIYLRKKFNVASVAQ